MLKKLWQKIKQNHLLMMLLCCLIPIIIIVGLLYLFKGREIGGYWIWLILLLCPILHIWMMKGMGHNEKTHKNNATTELYKCPECGLEYKEKEWAKKCENWCKARKSCNLKITKHAVKGRTKN